MIFKKLTLKNFMSYANAEIDFAGIHVACLIGANGAGKSSLLEAITWTLWEEGRARTDELVKLGKDEMSCEVEFFMEDELYRVYRSRNKALKNSQGKSNLEFQIFNSIENNWRSLSLSSTRQTQDLIIKTLKMDYPTFTNSVYLRQGKADEFTTKKPSERKQILSDILGLEMYDRLCEESRKRVKEIDQSISLDENLILSLKEKSLKEDEIKVGIEEISSRLKSEEIELEKIKSNLEIKEKELNLKKEKEKQIQLLERSKETQVSLIQTLEKQLNNLKAKEDKCKQLIENKAQIEKDHAEYLKSKNTFEILGKEKESYTTLTLEKSKLESELKDKIQKIEKDLAVFKSKSIERENLKLKLKEKMETESAFKNFFQRSQNEIKEFKNLQDKLLLIQPEAEKIKYDQKLLLSEIEKLEIKKNEIGKKIEVINKHDHSEPCPLCKSPIQDKKKVIESYEKDLSDVEAGKNKLNHEIKLKEDEVQKKRKEYSEIKEKINNYGKIIASLLPELSEIKKEKLDLSLVNNSVPAQAVSFFESQLEVVRSDFERIKEQLLTVENEKLAYDQEIKSLQEMSLAGVVVKELTEKIKNISEQIVSIKFDQKSYDDLKNFIKEKEAIASTFNFLKQAEDDIGVLSVEKDELALKIKSGLEEVNKIEASVKDSKKNIADLLSLSNEVSSIKLEKEKKDLTLREIRKEQTVKEQILKDINESKEIIKAKENKIQTSLSDRKYYDILEKAFSKNGIQAAIIETIVPEIEKEASRILSRLTENRMHIALKTQKEKKTGIGLIETLDIVISDEAGTRNYELYSGGEAFKVDFSLRLALSRLLTNRAGARLQTLIIDEGFGSQDSAGKERLVEVIKSIESEFELILVVTHIDELKESFPVQIQVSKDEEEGSKVIVMS